MADTIHLPCGNEPLHLNGCKILYITENGEYDLRGYVRAVVDIHDMYYDSYAEAITPDPITAYTENTYVGADLEFDAYASGKVEGDPTLITGTAESSNSYVGDDLTWDAQAEAVQGEIDATAESSNEYIGADLSWDARAEALANPQNGIALSEYEYDLNLQFSSNAKEVVE